MMKNSAIRFLLHMRKYHIGLTLISAGVLSAFVGCGYPTVSEKTYELSKALYSACNRQSEEQLIKIKELIGNSLEAQEISHREASWLNGIIQTAQQGGWESATSEVRRLMEDQIEY